MLGISKVVEELLGVVDRLETETLNAETRIAKDEALLYALIGRNWKHLSLRTARDIGEKIQQLDLVYPIPE